MVGNGVADSMYDGNALVPFAHGMGLISDQLFEVCSMDSYLFFHFVFWLIYLTPNEITGRTLQKFAVEISMTMIDLIARNSWLKFQW